MKRYLFTLSALFSLSLANPALADESADRGFVCDRPGATDNPHTLHQGRARLEVSAYESTRSHDATETTRTRRLGSFSFIYGVTEHAEVQVGSSGATREKGDVSGTLRGNFSDLTTRVKFAVLGNDGGPVAIAFIPRITKGTGADPASTTGGLAIPIGLELSNGWDLTLMPQLDVERLADDSSTVQIYTGVVLGRSIGENWGVFGQTATRGGQDTDWQQTVGAGVTYQVAPSVQLDAGADFGVSRDSPDSIFAAGIVFAF